jgi:hypothetical protein
MHQHTVGIEENSLVAVDQILEMYRLGCHTVKIQLSSPR